MSHKTVVISGKSVMRPDTVPSLVIADDALADCKGADRLYINEGVNFYDDLPEHGAWDCMKVPQSQWGDFFSTEKTWDTVSSGFFSGPIVHESEFLFKERGGAGLGIRWLELRPLEFQYICSVAFEMPREVCEPVAGRWLFTRGPKNGKLLLRLAKALMEGREVEQDYSMALRCSEQARWCAVGDEIPFVAGDVFPGIEVTAVDEYDDNPGMDSKWMDLNKWARFFQEEELLSHFQRLDIRMFERVDEGGAVSYRLRDLACAGRTDLRDVLLPDELRSEHVHIGRQAFAHCPNLRTINVRGMLNGFVLSRCADSFEDCPSLSDRIHYSLDGRTLLFCLNAPEDCTVCGHVDAIADAAFIHSARLRDFKWRCRDDSGSKRRSRRIGSRAFEGCRGLCIAHTEGCEIVLDSRAFADCQMLCEYRFGYYDRNEELDGIVAFPVSFLDISAPGVFEGCENIRHIFPTVTRNRGFLVVHEGSAGAQFARCRELQDCPSIIATRIPPSMFEFCGCLSTAQWVCADPDVIKAVVSGRRPASSSVGERGSVSVRAFAHCHSLERFKLCRMRASLNRLPSWTGLDYVKVELIDDNPKRVLFEHEAFLNCNRLRRHESSFSGAVNGSDPSAFRGCPDFADFVSE